jgi:plastocyanin domain-containing protein
MKSTILSVFTSALIIGGAVYFTKNSAPPPVAGEGINVSIVDGKQIIEINAKGGFSPIKSTARANIPTILRVSTNGTFDCSSAVRIPSMGISQNLPPSGIIEIDLGSPKVSVLDGTCGMGMYPFQIEFQG